LVKSLQESNRRIEHIALGLVVGHTLTDDRQRCSGRPDCFETSQDPVERSIDGHALQMRQLPAPWAIVRGHEHIWLKRTAKPALAAARATCERSNLAVIFG
jgi:hypothetical protein